MCYKERKALVCVLTTINIRYFFQYYSTSRLPPSSIRSSSVSSAVKYRPSSSDRTSNGLRRYGSDFSLNTPNRLMTPTGYGSRSRSPSSVRRVGAVAFPDSSRKEKKENSIKVMEILERDNNFFAQLNLHNGLKSMTVRQFLQIMDYFIRVITGKDMASMFGPKVDVTKVDAVGDRIIEFLYSIDCPYIVTKSTLKTPNAPHTFDQVVMLMLWLGNFCPSMDDAESMFEIKCDANLPSVDSTKRFSEDVMKSFQLFNSEMEDQNESLIASMVDNFISAKTNGNVNSVNDLGVEIKRLHTDSEQLKNTPILIPNEQLFKALKSDYDTCINQQEPLNTSIATKEDQLASFDVEWHNKKEALHSKWNEIRVLEKRIAKQKFTTKQMKDAELEIDRLNTEKDRMKVDLQLMHGETNDMVTKEARLLRTLSTKASEFNAENRRIGRVLQKTQVKADSNALSEVKPNVSLNELKGIARERENLKKKVHKETNKALLKAEKAESKLNGLKSDHQISLKLATETNKQYRKKLDQFNVIVDKKAKQTAKNSTNISKLVQRNNESEEKCMLLRSQISETKVMVDNATAENEQIMKDGEAEAMALIEEKQRMIDQLDVMQAQIDQVTEELLNEKK